MTYYKLLTPDYRPPIKGGDPIWDGVTLPYRLPVVNVDTGPVECSYGWNCVADLAHGFRVAGIWPTGYPNPVAVVGPAGRVVTRGAKTRSSELTVLRLATEEEIRAGLLTLAQPFGEHAEEIAEEQWLWREALRRPLHDPAAVKQGLQEALAIRGLADWQLVEVRDGTDTFPRDAWATFVTRDAWAAWATYATWAARDAWATYATRDARDAWATYATWAARDAWATYATWATWATWATLDAWDALMAASASVMGWWSGDAQRLTIGLRDAYKHGLAVAIPTGPTQLGWVMET